MKRIVAITLSTIAAGALLLSVSGCKTEHEQAQATAASNAYPLTKCVVSGEDLGDSPYVFTHNGKTVKLCCKDCLAKFDAEPDKYMAKLTPAK